MKRLLNFFRRKRRESDLDAELQAYLDELIVKKLNEDEWDKLHPKPPKENDISGNPSSAEERARIDKWPAEAKERWYQYEKAYKDRKKLIEAARAKTRPAATKPASTK